MSLKEISKPKQLKRLFIGLMLISLAALAAVSSGLYWFIERQNLTFNQIVLVVAKIAVGIFLLLLLFGLVAIVLSIWSSYSIPLLNKPMYIAINILYPLALTIGTWLGIEQNKIKNSYIHVSNQLVRVRQRGKCLSKILILAPHCLQESSCPHKVTVSPANCRRCGKCQVPELLDLADKHGASLSLVTGGTLARKVIVDTRPEGVVAVACERDLTSGIQEMNGLPVLGVINERPEGPCHNTLVDLDKVEEAIYYLKKGGM